MRTMTCAAVMILALAGPAYAQGGGSGQNDFQNLVTALPEVDRIDLLKVMTLQTDDVQHVDCTKADIVCGAHMFPLQVIKTRTYTGDDAIRIAAGWRQIKRDESRWCFVPEFVLRFYQGDKLLLETAGCFNCRKVSLPNEGVISIADYPDAFTPLGRELKVEWTEKRTRKRFNRFKREMMPQVNHRVTVIGVLEASKLGLAITFKEWDVELYSHTDSGVAKMNNLAWLMCHVVKVTGTLRHFTPPPPPPSKIPVQLTPEHFYFDVGKARVTNLYPLPIGRSKRKR